MVEVMLDTVFMTVDDLDLSVEDILSLAKAGKHTVQEKGTKLVSFPKAPPIEAGGKSVQIRSVVFLCYPAT